MRVLSRLRTHQNHYTAFQDTHVGRALEQVHSAVHTILMGTTDAIRTQEEQNPSHLGSDPRGIDASHLPFPTNDAHGRSEVVSCFGTHRMLADIARLFPNDAGCGEDDS